MWCHNEGNYSLMSNFFPNGRQTVKVKYELARSQRAEGADATKKIYQAKFLQNPFKGILIGISRKKVKVLPGLDG